MKPLERVDYMRLSVSYGLAITAIVLTGLFGVQARGDTELPEGQGRDVVIRMCTGCHPIEMITAVHLSKTDWQRKVEDMVNRGAKGTPSEIATVVNYLSAHFGVEGSGLQSKSVATVSALPNSNSITPSATISQVTSKQLAPFPNWQLPIETQWPAYGNDLGGMKYSPLTQITPKNVGNLKRAWTYASGDSGFTFEVTPIVINGVMYLSTSMEKVVALNADTGQEIWRFDPHVSRAREHRGVSYWPGDDHTSPRVILATSDGRLFALDAKTGKPCNDFGDNGVVNLKTGVTDNPNAPYSVSSPPAIYKNLVILGPELPENGRYGPSGDPRAFDVRTGKLVWRFHTIPQPGEPGFGTWGPNGWQNRSGPSLWGIITVDVEHHMVFCPVGNPTDQVYGASRPGTNLYSSSLIALDADTGKLKWYFQVTHHDIFDYDVSAPPALIEVHKDGRSIPAVAQMTKQGLLFILDRFTGKPIFGVEERPVPKTDAPGDEAWPTQPFPIKPPPLARMSMTRDEVSKITTESAKTCTTQFEHVVQQGPYTPYGMQPTLVFPSSEGGGNWAGPAFDPKLGYLFVNVRNLGTLAHLVPFTSGGQPSYMKVKQPFEDQNGYPCSAPPWGELIAVNANTGDIVWRVPLGEYSALSAMGIKPTGTPNAGGPIVTASGVLFIGSTTDYRFRAFEAKTGKELWSTQLEESAIATPITYQGANGKQYVVIACGGAGHLRSFVKPAPKEQRDLVVAFTLP